jgi:hypothetical protein
VANHERDVTLLQVDDDAVEIVGPERATFAARVPVWSKHEVLHDQLGFVAE